MTSRKGPTNRHCADYHKQRVALQEDQGLAAVVAWCRDRGILCWHTENERKRTPAQAAQAKRKGLLSGVADLIVVVPGKNLGIELKRHPDDEPSKAQRKWLADVRRCGWLTFVGDWKGAIQWLQSVLDVQ